MTIDQRKIALLHVAKAKLGLSDETYRRALAHIAGVTSAFAPVGLSARSRRAVRPTGCTF